MDPVDPRLLEIRRLAEEIAGGREREASAPASVDQLLDEITQTLGSCAARLREEREERRRLELFFDESQEGFFFMMLDEPVAWDASVDKEEVLERVFATQRITHANQAMLEQYGASSEDFIGLTPRDFFEHDIEQGKQAWRKLFELGVLATRTREQRFDGSPFWVQGVYVVLRDDQGRILGHFGAQRDVSEEVATIDALRRSEARLDEAQRIAHLGHWDWDVTSNDLAWSNEIYRIFGLEPSGGVANYDDFVNATHPEDRAPVEAAVQAALKGAPYSIEHRVVRPNGEVRWVHEQGEVDFDPERRAVRMLGTAQDITERRAVESALRAAHALSDGVLRASPIGISIYDESGQCIDANDALAEIVGSAREHVLSTSWSTSPWWEKSGLLAAARLVLESGARERRDIEVTTPSGRRAALSCQLVPLEVEGDRRLLVMVEDISERLRAERAVKRSLHEKEILLQEIHHRVKNNLQVIKSLLHLQMGKLADEGARGVFQESMDRVQVMAVLHEKLYQSKSLASISLPEYIASLVSNLSESYRAESRPIEIRLDVDRRSLDVDRAIPLGLLLNEVVSNALKHAFPGDRGGTVDVRGRARDSGHFAVTVRDDGVGLRETFDPLLASSLGLKLIKNLAKQLDAELTIDGSSGTSFEIVLAPDTARAPSSTPPPR